MTTLKKRNSQGPKHQPRFSFRQDYQRLYVKIGPLRYHLATMDPSILRDHFNVSEHYPLDDVTRWYLAETGVIKVYKHR